GRPPEPPDEGSPVPVPQARATDHPSGVTGSRPPPVPVGEPAPAPSRAAGLLALLSLFGLLVSVVVVGFYLYEGDDYGRWSHGPPPAPAAAAPPPPAGPHPSFWWALLWCVFVMLATQIPGALAASAVLAVVAVRDPDSLRDLSSPPVGAAVVVGVLVAHGLLI